jgi:ankyrin repeat protein
MNFTGSHNVDKYVLAKFIDISNAINLLVICKMSKYWMFKKNNNLREKNTLFITSRDHEERIHEKLHFVCLKNNHECLKLLIKFGINIHTTDYSHRNILHISCINGAYECAKLLIDHKININAITLMENTALHYACINGEYECAKLLIDHKININATSIGGNTALHLACQNNYEKCKMLLIKNNIDINIKNKDGYIASYYG